MIRINLLGQIRPRATRRPMAMDTGAAMPVVFIGVGVAVGLIVLGFFYYTWQKQLTEENNRIKTLRAQKTELEQIKQQVETFEKQKTILQQRVATIEQLQRDRTGGQERLRGRHGQSVSRHVGIHAGLGGVGHRGGDSSSRTLRSYLASGAGTGVLR